MTDHQDYIEDTTGQAPHAGAPVDVRVVEAVLVHDFPARSWSPQQFTLTADTQPIAPPNHARVSLRLTNTGTTTVFLGPSQSNCSPTSSYPLAAGASIVLESRAAVWACAPTGGTLATLAQFKDG